MVIEWWERFVRRKGCIFVTSHFLVRWGHMSEHGNVTFRPAIRHFGMADDARCPHCGTSGQIRAERVIAANQDAFIKSHCDHCKWDWTVSDGQERRASAERRRVVRRDRRHGGR